MAALEYFHRRRERQRVLLFAISVGALDDAGVEVAVFLQLTASNGIDDLRAGAAVIGVEIGTALRNHFGLVLHVLTAAGDEENGGEPGEG
jgi:hypothetical protein